MPSLEQRQHPLNSLLKDLFRVGRFLFVILPRSGDRIDFKPYGPRTGTVLTPAVAPSRRVRAGNTDCARSGAFRSFVGAEL
jgi:hypothetical protein